MFPPNWCSGRTAIHATAHPSCLPPCCVTHHRSFIARSSPRPIIRHDDHANVVPSPAYRAAARPALYHERSSSKRLAQRRQSPSRRSAFASQKAPSCQSPGRAQETSPSTPSTVQASNQLEQTQGKRLQGNQQRDVKFQLLRCHASQGRPEDTRGMEASSTTEWWLVGPPASSRGLSRDTRVHHQEGSQGWRATSRYALC